MEHNFLRTLSKIYFVFLSVMRFPIAQKRFGGPSHVLMMSKVELCVDVSIPVRCCMVWL